MILGILFFIFLVLIVRNPPEHKWIRQKTAREEALHGQIQDAMNWSPDHFHQREDGRWFNAHGVEGKVYNLEELRKLLGKNESS